MKSESAETAATKIISPSDAIPGAFKIASFDFAANITGSVCLALTEAQYLLVVETKSGPKARARRYVMALPINLFVDANQFGEWAAATESGFKKVIAESLLPEVFGVFIDAANFSLNEKGIEQVDLRAHADLRGRQISDRIKKRFGLKAVGRYSQWTKFELSRAILREMRALGSNEPHTYSRVAAALKKTHGEKAPQSADALRQMVKRFELSWKDLKRTV